MRPDPDQLLDRLESTRDGVLVLSFRVTDIEQLARTLDAGGRDTGRLLLRHARRAVLA